MATLLLKNHRKGFINVAGYESPGLTSIPAVAHYVVEEIVKPLIPDIEENHDYNPKVRKHLRFDEMTAEEKVEIIKQDPKYGKVICRCETITEGEIIDVIHRSAGARTVKSVKKTLSCRNGPLSGWFLFTSRSRNSGQN